MELLFTSMTSIIKTAKFGEQKSHANFGGACVTTWKWMNCLVYCMAIW